MAGAERADISSEELITRLAAAAAPVRRVPTPGRRLLLWLAVSIQVLALVVWLNGPRPDLAALLARPGFLAAEAFALVTALAGGYAALCAGVPGQPTWKLLLPAVTLAGWIGFLGKQCWDVYVRLGPAGLVISGDAMCVPAIAVSALIPTLVMAVAIYRGIGYRLRSACLCGALGAGALAEAALRLYHPQDAAVMVLVWQIGSVALFAAAASLVGQFLLARARA